VDELGRQFLADGGEAGQALVDLGELAAQYGHRVGAHVAGAVAGPQAGHERADVLDPEADREQRPDLPYHSQLGLVVDAVPVAGALCLHEPVCLVVAQRAGTRTGPLRQFTDAHTAPHPRCPDAKPCHRRQRNTGRDASRSAVCAPAECQSEAMAGIEHFNDPDAPRANSLVVAVTVFVMDEHDRVLLVHRADAERWELPGGAQEVGEYIAATAVRTTRAQSGIDVEVTGLVGVYSNPHHVVEFANGEVRQQFSLCLRARYLGGVPAGGDGIGEVRWVPSDALDDLPIHPSTRLRVDHGYNRMPQPYLG